MAWMLAFTNRLELRLLDVAIDTFDRHVRQKYCFICILTRILS